MAPAHTPRYLTPAVTKDLKRKMVFIGGPRQVGKTTLAVDLLGKAKSRYLNWDFDEDRASILNREWPAGRGLLVLDEIHKYRQWRSAIKGLFDKRRGELQILVTGSARLDYYRFGGDSLQGRYFYYRLHPLSVRELGIRKASELNDLLQLSGFPEPFLNGSLKEKKRWSTQHRSRLVREDLRDLERVMELGALEQLVLRLPELVGSPLSVNGLREDLQISHPAIARWLEILERLYVIFRVHPFGPPRIKALKKAAKHYHFDWSLVPDAGARLENLVAAHLLKWCHYEYDTAGRGIELRYFRDVEGREVDFVILEDQKPIRLIECQSSRRPVDKSLIYLKRRYPGAEAVQLTGEAGVNLVTSEGVRIISVIDFLATLV